MATRSTRDEKWERLERDVEEKLKQARKRALLAESFDELEEIVEETGREIEQELLEAMAEQRESTGRARCPKCGEPMYRRGTKARQLKTSRGKVKIERARWICPTCGASLFPPGSEPEA